MADTHDGFQRDRYAVVRGMVGDSLCSFLYKYVVKLAASGRLSTTAPDVPNTPHCYSDPFMEALLEALKSSVQALSGEPVQPTYSYFRVYKRGDVLARHTDRPSCEVSLTLMLGRSDEASWPLWIEVAGKPLAVSLEPGDALLYKGIEIPHWRERFEGERMAQVFLHYVNEQGANREWIHDKRGGLGVSAAARDIVARFGRTVGLGHFQR